MIEQDLRDWLFDGPVTVSFTKKDGTARTMNCTTRGELIPTEHRPKLLAVHTSDTMEVVESVIHTKPAGLFNVYDLDKQGWRSFYFESITNVGIPTRD